MTTSPPEADAVSAPTVSLQISDLEGHRLG